MLYSRADSYTNLKINLSFIQINFLQIYNKKMEQPKDYSNFNIILTIFFIFLNIFQDELKYN